ncbi:MAG: hypothetical protein ACYDDA_13725 [Acidiferrobacteraceae bacterium]
MTAPITKPGAHGTLYRYAIKYRDAHDPCCPEMVWHCWAYNLDHAEEKFYGDGDEGWRIVSLARVSDAASQHRAVQHAPRSS